VVVKATKNADKSAAKNAPFGWVRFKKSSVTRRKILLGIALLWFQA
jgi:hypothetical protein